MPGADRHHSLATIEPQRAAVTPRVRVLPSGGAAQPLEQVLRRLLDGNVRGPVLLTGRPGSGKTTAIAHLRAVIPVDAKIDILDEPPFVEIPKFTGGLGLVALADDMPGDWLMRLELVPWSEEDRK